MLVPGGIDDSNHNSERPTVSLTMGNPIHPYIGSKELTVMTNKTQKTKAKRLPKGQRIHTRRLKQAARRPEEPSPAPKH